MAGWDFYFDRNLVRNKMPFIFLRHCELFDKKTFFRAKLLPERRVFYYQFVL